MSAKKMIKNLQQNNLLNNLLNNLFFKIIYYTSVIIYTVMLGISNVNTYKGDNKLLGLLKPEFIYLVSVIIIIGKADTKKRNALLPILSAMYFLVYFTF
jgi:hypothetical protein